MNILLFAAEELTPEGRCRLDGHRLEHVRKVIGKGPGDALRVGLRHGGLGTGIIEDVDGAWWVRVAIDRAPPPKVPLCVVLALPRPPVFKRVLSHLTTLGVARLVLLHTKRVEKSYWSSPALDPRAIADQIDLALEQAVDTEPPSIEFAPRFRPFVEDRLPELVGGGRLLVADPSGASLCPCDVRQPATLVVGPEGGFIPFELERLALAGAECFGLGPRILRVETAAVALVARLAIGIAAGPP